MITRFNFIANSDRLIPGGLRAKGQLIVEALAKKVTWWMLLLQQKIQGEKLSGDVLKARSGKLRSSINVAATEHRGTQLVGTVEGAGGPAWYGQLHEDGGTFNVKEYVRRIGYDKKGDVTRLLTQYGSVKTAVQSVSRGTVKAHTITFPQRSFMKSALEELEIRMISDLQNTMERAAK